MRLIDADYLMCDIGCFDAVKYGNETPEQQHNSYSTLMMYEIADYINDAETVDAVEVVRCKDCRHTVHSRIYPEVLICTLTKMCGETDPGFFCANGEREVQE